MLPKTTTCAIGTLIADPKNVRFHGQANHDAIKLSIERHGLRKPIVAQENTNIVYAGNETLNVLKELGYTEVSVAWIPADWSEKQCREYAILDNRTNDLSEFDMSALNALLDESLIAPFDVGFDALPEFAALDVPEDFKTYDEQNVETDYECPKCGYKWSGRKN